MSARHKLNVAAFNGCLVVGTLAGLAFDSWAVFWLVVIVLLAGDVAGGVIRPSSAPDRRRKT